MARAITWQDVEAPRQAANIEVAMRAGRMLQDAVAGIGETAVGIQDDIRKTNTEAAVATIANSADPTAAAAAVPQGWQFDPLAIAGATNARTDQLKKNELQDLSIKNTNLQMQQTQAELDDRVAARDAEDIALQYRDAALGGKPVNIDREDPRWRTAAGKLALDRIDGWTRDAADMKYKQDSLSLQRAAAARAARDDAERRRLDTALGQVVEFSASPEGAGAAPEERDRRVAEIFKRNGVGLQHLDLGQKAYDLGFGGNKATAGELERVDPKTGLSGKKLLDAQALEVQAAERAFNQWKADNAALLRVGQLDATNPYEKLDDITAANKVLEAIPDVKEGWGPNWDVKDVIQRADGIKNWAKDNGYTLTRAQQFMLVPKTKGQFGLGDTFNLVDKSIEQDIKDFDGLTKAGGWEQVAADAKAQEAGFESAKQRAARAGAAINAAVRGEGPLPDKLVTGYKTSPVVQRNEAERELSAVDIALGNAANMTAAEVQSLYKRKKAAEDTLARLK